MALKPDDPEWKYRVWPEWDRQAGNEGSVDPAEGRLEISTGPTEALV